jgi:hypothetical protein
VTTPPAADLRAAAKTLRNLAKEARAWAQNARDRVAAEPDAFWAGHQRVFAKQNDSRAERIERVAAWLVEQTNSPPVSHDAASPGGAG